jgi:putative membrane protein
MNIVQTIPLADAWMHGDWGWGWMLLMMVVMVLFLGAFIFVIFWLIRSATRDSSAPAETRGSKESPIEILERRFAEGDISEEDYCARRQTLADGTNR